MREKRAPRKRFRGAKINPDVLSGGQMLCRNGLKINSGENISAEKTAEPRDRVRARMKMAEMDRHQVRYRSRKSQYLMKNPKIGMKQIESMRLARIEISPYNSARIDTVGRALFHARRRQSFASLPDQRSIQATPGITPTSRLSRGLREIRISMRLCVAIEQFPTIIRTGPATRRNAASSHSRTGARCIHRPPYWATLIS
ncbi:hypothetical protein [Burkholderia cepacia]|uniref:hypothetical protein n=1 Tax=Burkholderia cepacia TaxID=292 RepID=UPI0011BD5ACF|nr:hypothetical protein [Burkholderia cepacia]